MAQLVAHCICNAAVLGSIPSVSIEIMMQYAVNFSMFYSRIGMKQKSSSGTSVSSSSSDEMMIDDAIQRIVDFARESEERIERVIDRMQASRDSSGTASSKVSRSSKSGNRDAKYQLKIAEEFRKYIEQTAIRVIMMFKEISSLKTLMTKAYVQQALTLQNEDPHAFIASLQNPDLAHAEYMRFTEFDQMGFYILSHFFVFGTYVQPLQAVGADRAYWSYMCKEILNSMTSTPLIQSFFQFVAKHKENIEFVGLDTQDMINTMRVKFEGELYALYNVMVSLPVKVGVAGQNLSYRFDQAYMLARDYLSRSHMHGFIESIAKYMHTQEQQIGQATGIQVGGSRSKPHDKHVFAFKRFSKVGSKRALF